MLQLTIAGTLGKDAEVRTVGQSVVCNFSVAVSGYDFKAKAKTTQWVRVAIWGKRGEQLGRLLTKGNKVALTGEMTLNEYNGKTSIEVKAQDVTLLGGAPRQERPSPDEGFDPVTGDDDIPF